MGTRRTFGSVTHGLRLDPGDGRRDTIRLPERAPSTITAYVEPPRSPYPDLIGAAVHRMLADVYRRADDAHLAAIAAGVELVNETWRTEHETTSDGRHLMRIGVSYRVRRPAT